MVLFTKEFSSSGNHLWCLDIESGASTGWIATNWLEDLILHQQGPEIYDQWSNQEIVSGSDEMDKLEKLATDMVEQFKSITGVKVQN